MEPDWDNFYPKTKQNENNAREQIQVNNYCPLFVLLAFYYLIFEVNKRQFSHQDFFYS